MRLRTCRGGIGHAVAPARLDLRRCRSPPRFGAGRLYRDMDRCGRRPMRGVSRAPQQSRPALPPAAPTNGVCQLTGFGRQPRETSPRRPHVGGVRSMSASMRSAMRWAGSRNGDGSRPHALGHVVGRSVVHQKSAHGAAAGRRSATVMKTLRRPWYQKPRRPPRRWSIEMAEVRDMAEGAGQEGREHPVARAESPAWSA